MSLATHPVWHITAFMIAGAEAFGGIGGRVYEPCKASVEIHEITAHHAYTAVVNADGSILSSRIRRLNVDGATWPPLDLEEWRRNVCGAPQALESVLQNLDRQLNPEVRALARDTLLAAARKMAPDNPAAAGAIRLEVGTRLFIGGHSEAAAAALRELLDSEADVRSKVIAHRMLGQYDVNRALDRALPGLGPDAALLESGAGHFRRIISSTDTPAPLELRARMASERRTALDDLAAVHRWRREWDQAIDVRTRLLAEALTAPGMIVTPPERVRYRIENARDYVSIGRIEDALREYDRALTEHPTYIENPESVFLRFERLEAMGLSRADPRRIAELEAIWNDEALASRHPVQVGVIGLEIANALWGAHMSSALSRAPGANDRDGATKAVSFYAEVVGFYADHWERLPPELIERHSLDGRFRDAVNRLIVWHRRTGDPEEARRLDERARRLVPHIAPFIDHAQHESTEASAP